MRRRSRGRHRREPGAGPGSRPKAASAIPRRSITASNGPTRASEFPKKIGRPPAPRSMRSISNPVSNETPSCRSVAFSRAPNSAERWTPSPSRPSVRYRTSSTVRPPASPNSRRIGRPWAATASPRPSASSTENPVGWMMSPDPTGRGEPNRSTTTTRCPARARNSAAASPPIPAPATAISSPAISPPAPGR